MTANGSTDVVLDDRDGFVLLGEQLANPVGVFFRIGVANKSKVTVFGMGLFVEGCQLLQALLATMRRSCQRKLAIGVEIQQRLQVKLGACKSDRSGNAATTMKGIEVVNHKQVCTK